MLVTWTSQASVARWRPGYHKPRSPAGDPERTVLSRLLAAQSKTSRSPASGLDSTGLDRLLATQRELPPVARWRPGSSRPRSPAGHPEGEIAIDHAQGSFVIILAIVFL
ncbi:hypothetical protein YC2023_107562 [Brassica napus]